MEIHILAGKRPPSRTFVATSSLEENLNQMSIMKVRGTNWERNKLKLEYISVETSRSRKQKDSKTKQN